MSVVSRCPPLRWLKVGPAHQNASCQKQITLASGFLLLFEDTKGTSSCLFLRTNQQTSLRWVSPAGGTEHRWGKGSGGTGGALDTQNPQGLILTSGLVRSCLTGCSFVPGTVGSSARATTVHPNSQSRPSSWYRDGRGCSNASSITRLEVWILEGSHELPRGRSLTPGQSGHVRSACLGLQVSAKSEWAGGRRRQD